MLFKQMTLQTEHLPRVSKLKARLITQTSLSKKRLVKSTRKKTVFYVIFNVIFNNMLIIKLLLFLYLVWSAIYQNIYRIFLLRNVLIILIQFTGNLLFNRYIFRKNYKA